MPEKVKREEGLTHEIIRAHALMVMTLYVLFKGYVDTVSLISVKVSIDLIVKVVL